MYATQSQYLEETSNIQLRKSLVPIGVRVRRKTKTVLQNPRTHQEKSQMKSFPLTNGSLLQNPDIKNSSKIAKLKFLMKHKDIRYWLSDLKHFQELEINSILFSKQIPNHKDDYSDDLIEQTKMTMGHFFPGYVSKQKKRPEKQETQTTDKHKILPTQEMHNDGKRTLVSEVALDS
jgi:hypothetical protein